MSVKETAEQLLLETKLSLREAYRLLNAENNTAEIEAQINAANDTLTIATIAVDRGIQYRHTVKTCPKTCDGSCRFADELSQIENMAAAIGELLEQINLSENSEK